MAFTYDPTTDLGRVRLLISDVSSNADRQIFQDAEIEAFLAMNVGVKRAAAAALLVIAANELFVSKVIRSQDLQTDAAKVAAELRQLATRLRNEANADDDDSDDGGFSIVDFDPHSAYRLRY